MNTLWKAKQYFSRVKHRIQKVYFTQRLFHEVIDNQLRIKELYVYPLKNIFFHYVSKTKPKTFKTSKSKLISKPKPQN
jgi:hypothetical protein